MGEREACPILIKGLHRLEYRGYDSAGVALVNRDGALNVYKCKGKVSDLEHFLAGKDLDGTIGIAHTRWATHGVPNDANAHPHYSESENIALIHNGIIENFRVLKDALTANGYTFRSSTDSEVLVNLIEYVRTTNGCTLLEAVQQALKQVVGAYAIAVIEKGNRDEIIAARQSSPMVVGIGQGEYFLSSDAASIIESPCTSSMNRFPVPVSRSGRRMTSSTCCSAVMGTPAAMRPTSGTSRDSMIEALSPCFAGKGRMAAAWGEGASSSTSSMARPLLAFMRMRPLSANACS